MIKYLQIKFKYWNTVIVIRNDKRYKIRLNYRQFRNFIDKIREKDSRIVLIDDYNAIDIGLIKKEIFFKESSVKKGKYIGFLFYYDLIDNRETHTSIVNGINIDYDFYKNLGKEIWK